MLKMSGTLSYSQVASRHDRCPGGMISSPRVCVTVCVGVCKFVCSVLCVRERAMIHASIAHWVVFHITVCVCPK